MELINQKAASCRKMSHRSMSLRDRQIRYVKTIKIPTAFLTDDENCQFVHLTFGFSTDNGVKSHGEFVKL